MKKVVTFIILSALIFATMEVALKYAGSTVDPLQMTFLRFLIGGLILLPLGIAELRRNNTKLDARLILRMFILGTICVPVSMIMFQYGVMHANAATASVIFCVNPVFTAFFAHFLNKNDKFTKMKAVSIAFAVPGIVMMMRPWDIQPGNTILGALLMIGAAATFSLYSVIGTRTLVKVGTFAQTALCFIFGAAVLLVVMLFMGRPVFSGLSGNIPIVLYVGIVVTGLGYLLYFLSIKYSNASTGSITFFLKPAIAPFVAVLILHEKITWNMYIGIVLILLASFIILVVPLVNEKKNDKIIAGGKTL
jgi:drug/metabolite transporter (DMT)-like permease